MRVKSKVNVRIFESTAEEDMLFGPDDDRAEVTIDEFNEESSARFRIAASGSLALSLGSMTTVRGLYIRALGDYDITLNGAATDIEVRRYTGATSTVPGKFYFDGTVTSVTVTNTSSTAELVGYYAMWGDQ